MAQDTQKSNKRHAPKVLFDALLYIQDQRSPTGLSKTQKLDYEIAHSFIICYTGSQGTFNAYRREVERLLQFTWLIAGKSLKELRREDIEKHIYFCRKPPKAWIGLKKAPRFIDDSGMRKSNPEWRPFVAVVSKAAFKKGERPSKDTYELSQQAVKDMLAILSSFFNYMLQEEYVVMNPVAMIRQKSKFIRKQQGKAKIRRLSDQQWQTVIRVAEKMAQQFPEQHERTLFIMSCLYSMYLRISELSVTERWEPTMNDFQRDHDGLWWFTTVGKGNKERQIAVSDEMLHALKRWRKYLGLTQLPSHVDDSPLLPKIKGKGGITNSTFLREIVQSCFDNAIDELKNLNEEIEAESLMDATVHWLRHTGISDDVKIRPREHVRDDAGHGSGAITDRYIDIELKERHKSARKKPIQTD